MFRIEENTRSKVETLISYLVWPEKSVKKVTHRKDLASKDLEAIWVPIKFPTTSALFSVIYRWELVRGHIWCF